MIAVVELKGEWTLAKAQMMFNDTDTSVRFIADDCEEIEASSYDTGTPDNLALEFEDIRYPGQQMRWRAAPVVEGEMFAGNEWKEFNNRAKGQVIQAIQAIYMAQGANFVYRSDEEEDQPAETFTLHFSKLRRNSDTGLNERYEIQVVVEPLGEGTAS